MPMAPKIVTAPDSWFSASGKSSKPAAKPSAIETPKLQRPATWAKPSSTGADSTGAPAVPGLRDARSEDDIQPDPFFDSASRYQLIPKQVVESGFRVSA